jgi:hypothetical protein
MKTKLLTYKDIGILFVWIFISTYANNYFFFNHASRDVDRDIIHLAKNIKTFTSYCMDVKSNEEECIVDIKDFIEKTPVYYKASYTITHKDGSELLKVGKIDSIDKTDGVYDLFFLQENKHLHRFKKLFSARKFNLSDEEIDDLSQLHEINAVLNIQKYAPPSTLSTVYNSFTFSASGWLPKIYNERYTEAFEYIMNVSLPRSWPTIFFTIFAYFLYRYIKYKEVVHNNSMLKQDKKRIDEIQNAQYENILQEELMPYKEIIEETIPVDKLLDFIHSYPAGCLGACRVLAEDIVNDLDDFTSSSDDQFVKINTLLRKNIIDKKIHSALHNIRVLGNVSVHKSDTIVDKNDTIAALNNLLAVLKAHKRS